MMGLLIPCVGSGVGITVLLTWIQPKAEQWAVRELLK